MEGAIAEPTRVEEVAEVMQDASSPHEDGPITPAKGPAPAKVAAAAAEREHQAAGGPDAAALAPGSEECTPEKEKQGAGKPQRSVGGEALSPAEVQAQACQQLYYGVLRAVFKQMDLYASGSADLLDPRKQLLVYHHAARVFEFRKIVMTVLRGEPDDTKLAELPVTYRSAIKGFRREAAESGSLPAPESIREKMVFGHEGVIKLVEPPVVPVGAKKSCILLREKPHAMTDNVKHISAFRDAIKFKCNQNPLTLIDEHGLGLVLMVEGTTPKAFIIVSPFLTEPAGLEALCAKERVGMTHLEKALGTQVVEFIAKETDGWRTFIQRRANILSKGSRVAIEKVLRSRNRIADGAAAPAAAAEGMVEAMEELKEELETARSRAKQAEKALERTESLESKLKKTEKKLAEYKKLQDRHVSSEELENTLKAATTSRKRPSAEDDEEEEEPRVVQVTDSKLEGKLRKVGKKIGQVQSRGGAPPPGARKDGRGGGAEGRGARGEGQGDFHAGDEGRSGREAADRAEGLEESQGALRGEGEGGGGEGSRGFAQSGRCRLARGCQQRKGRRDATGAEYRHRQQSGVAPRGRRRQHIAAPSQAARAGHGHEVAGPRGEEDRGTRGAGRR
mmetsp:Transcript_52358/g.168721  ORF Transcript_52358/g.168721 Transcript_52358/m.168721 type:complete len:620 (-) Transcript_52358:189-2048(-)